MPKLLNEYRSEALELLTSAINNINSLSFLFAGSPLQLAFEQAVSAFNYISMAITMPVVDRKRYYLSRAVEKLHLVIDHLEAEVAQTK